ncbi:bifunctional 4-hydroxy-2-oxoglutarate aldolase/2-dehydro-3-deoxy-phosphogluconate aldolase [Halostella sp. JP-L12]|uniref:bifunctional 4-hydroxy-2-oxoglutarate aldolase/2-dehydro-3-deoxy-phosphogluconate aldolase n=1 Tax=Halostella TaxID=1843185 RepID=UPI000EF79FCA|nr:MULTISPECIES: bifunctional 4-hydroxy-2-oxoglutarate aldolase/2-dehydro-3-deoxy-phosphogluconate aldolase [Halostella]NHN48489.1 bifunctional 4-hydroxy-2-oxoglutarate aldolase/2-dehydro-3-deoxy-phosphogluconate aldolase [Halostella sp. JP-L12]
MADEYGYDRTRRIVEGGVIGIMRGVDREKAVDVAAALRDGGVTAIEVTADTPGALDMIEDVAGAMGDDVLVGAGTVLDSETARAALLAGAEFVVTPSLNEGVVETCNRYGAPVAPGVATPTEAVRAFEAGADLAKVFPAASLGPDHVASIGGPLGQIPLVPTGGVSLDNVEAFVEAGAVAVGVGSSLVDDEAVAAEDYDALRERASAFADAVADAK